MAHPLDYLENLSAIAVSRNLMVADVVLAVSDLGIFIVRAFSVLVRSCYSNICCWLL